MSVRAYICCIQLSTLVSECLAAAQVDDYDEGLGPSSYLKSEEAYLK